MGIKFKVIHPNDEHPSKIYYGCHNSPFGKSLVGVTEEDEVCHVAFVVNSEADALEELENFWPKSSLTSSSKKTKAIAQQIFSDDSEKYDYVVVLKGTEFEVKVWKELIKIPKGETITYKDIAVAINNPGAVRAVGTAVGKSNIGYLLPCHRVTNKMGCGKYRWGVELKQRILKSEQDED